jgi:type IV pilus assembly protein PilA
MVRVRLSSNVFVQPADAVRASSADPDGRRMLLAKSIVERGVARPDYGFTLIELMVVVLIIAILLAIAIPTFLGARNSANARAAQSNLGNAAIAEQQEWTSAQSFSSSVATMKGIELGLNWTTVGATTSTPNQVAVTTNSNNDVVRLQAQGKDGNCYYIELSDNPTTSYTGYGEVTGACATTPSSPPSTPTVPTAGAASGHVGSTAGGAPVFYTSW